MRYLALDGPDSSAGVDSAFPMPWEQPSPAQAKEAPAWMPPSTVAPPDRAPRADGQNTGTPSWAPWGTFGEAPAVAADLSDLALGMVTSFLQESEGPGSGGETRERGVAGAWERPWGDREAGGQEDKEVVGPHGRPDSRIGAPVGGSGAGGAAGQGAGGWGTSMSLFSMPVDTMEIEEGEGEGSCADEVGEEEGMSDVGDDDGSGVGGGAGRFLWLGNLKHGLKKSTLLSIFRPFGRIQDVVMFPGKQFAFVNFVRTDDAVAAAQDLVSGARCGREGVAGEMRAPRSQAGEPASHAHASAGAGRQDHPGGDGGEGAHRAHAPGQAPPGSLRRAGRWGRQARRRPREPARQVR